MIVQSRPLSPVVPLPAPRGKVPLTTSFRSTWLSSSLRSLTKRNLIDRYFAALPRPFHESIKMSVAGVWLPVEVAEAHYAACDSLHLPTGELLAIGRETTEQVNATMLAVAVKLARNSGATPWTLLAQHQRIWERVWIGGAAGVYKAGPKDAVVEIAGWTCARFAYTRVAFRGVLQRLSEFFSGTVYVSEIDKMCDPTGLGYRVAWA